MSTISASTTSTTAFKITTDTTGALVFQTGASPTTAMTISSSQVVTYTNQPTYTGGTANGVAYLNGSKVLTTGTALVFDGANLGVGTAPNSGWQTGRNAFQLGTAALDTISAGQIVVRANNYYNGTNDKYISNGYATAYEQSGGTHRWYIAGSGTAGNNVSFTQSMMLDTSGNLGVGSTSPTALFTLVAANNFPFIHWNNSSNTTIAFAGWHGGSGGGDDFRIGTSSTKPITFHTNTTERARFNSGAAILCLSGGNTSATGTGIAFPSSYNASSDVNTLDDYEEGDWTPRLTGTSGGNYTPAASNSGRYIKIGKMVWATATLQWSAVVTGYTGNLSVSGLPFTSTGTRAIGSMGAVLNGLSFTAGYGEWVYLVDPGVTYVYIIQNSTTGAGYSHTPTVGSSGTVYALSIVYEAA